ncbi:MAG TPA: pilus (MSHA type) biogenesis protein MshL [Acidiferrobacterales bacterium]|nr:pilus (MSHA type) biogenesis protein MshL [Acidiferrobacterales bacterium]
MKAQNKFFQLALALVIAMLLAGCGTPYGWNKSVGRDIDQALSQAKKAGTKNGGVPADVNQALLPPIQITVPEGGTTPLEPHFDLAVNNAPARQVFIGLVEGTPYSMVVHPEVAGTISLNLKNATVPEAMETIRKVYGYEYKREGNRFLVLARGMQTRLFPVNYLNLVRRGNSDTRVAANGLTKSVTATTTAAGTTGTQTSSAGIQVQTQSLADFWKELEATVKSIIEAGPGRKVVANPQAGLLIVRAMPDELRVVEDFLGITQASLNRQVILEAKILDVELNDGFQTGINWANLGSSHGVNYTAGQVGGGTSLATGKSEIAGQTGKLDPTTGIFSPISGTNASAFGGVFSLAVQANNFAAFVELLKTQGKVNVLSSPRVSTVNNQKAVIKVGTDEFFVTNTTATPSSVIGGQPTVTAELTPFFSGIALDVTPQIDDVGNIVLHVHPSVNDVTQKTINVSVAGAGNLSLPSAVSSIQESDNIVRASSGQIIVIGGLMKEGSTEDNASVPFLGDIPLLGNLFKHKRVTRIKKELVILLKPTFVEGNQVWNEAVQDSQERVSKIR